MINLGSAYGEIQIGTGGAEQSVQSLAQSMRSVGSTMSVAISAPLAAVGLAGLNAAADFEQSLSVMQQVSGATESAMQGLQAQAIQLGADTSFSAGEAAEGMLELSKAGFDAQQTMAAISGVLDLAAAGNLSVAQAAEISANALNSFNLPASEATRVADLLAAAANSSSVEVSDLAYGFQMAGAVFASNKQPIDDLSTALAILGNNGLKGSDAGTSLKTMMMSLAAPTDKARGELNNLGIAIYNADGSMRSFEAIIGSLETATAGLNDEQRNLAFSTIFGSDAIRAANILVGEGADEFGRMKTAVNAQGAAAQVANARMKGLRGAIEYAKGTIESTLISAVLPFTESLAGMVRSVADVIGSFTSLPEPVRNAALAFAAVLAAAGPLLVAIPMIAGVLGALLSPIGLIVAGVAALAAAWVGDFMSIRTITLSTIDRLSPIFEGLYDIFVAGEEPLGDWSYWWERMGDVVGETAASLIADVAEIASGIEGAIGAIAQGDWQGAQAALNGLGESFAWLWKDIQAIDWGGVLASATDSLAGLAGGVVTALGAIDWAGALETAGGWLDGFKNGVVTAVTAVDWGGLLAQAGEFLAGLRDGVVGAVTSIDWAGGLAAAGAWLDALKNGVVSAVQSIPWAEALTAAGDFLSGLWGGVTGALTAIDWGTALATAAGWLDTLKAQIVSAIQGIDWAGAMTTAGNAFSGLETAVTGGLRGLGFAGAAESLSGLKTALTGLPESINGARASLSGLWATIAPVAATVAAFFAPAIERLQAAFTALPEKLAPLLPKLEALGGAIGGLMTALQPFVLLIGGVLAVAVEFGINRLTTAFETLPSVLGVIIDQVTATINLISTVLTEVVDAVQAIIDGDWSTVWESAKTVIQAFITFFRGLFSRLGTFMGAVARNISEPIIQTLKTLGVDIVPHLESVRKFFEDIWGKVLTYIQPVIDLVESVQTAIEDFSAWLATVTLPNPFQPLVDAWNTVANHLPGSEGGIDGNPATPYALGTAYAARGLALVGERGPELIDLRGGERIYDAQDTNRLLGGSAQPQVVVYANVASDMDIHQMAYQVAAEFKRWGRG
jgi:TP901 family phage tail tape measure protein